MTSNFTHQSVILTFIIILQTNFILVTGECEEAVTCKTSGVEIHSLSGKTAKSSDYHFVTYLPEGELSKCKQRCETYCKEEGPQDIEEWPNCKAFSSYVVRGGTCWCYGWKSKPSWYEDSDYNSGWCEK